METRSSLFAGNGGRSLFDSAKKPLEMIGDRTKVGPVTKAEMVRLSRKVAAAEILKKIDHGMDLYGYIAGSFSMIDLIIGAVELTGPAACDISTWTVGPSEIEDLEELTSAGKITKIRWLMDTSMHRRESPRYALILEKFGPAAVRLTNNHAKIFLIYNADWKISILSSANFNMNPRTEWVLIRDNCDFLEFNKGIFDEYFQKK